MAEAPEDRTEAASPRRLQKARDAGNVAVSRELAMLVSVACGVAVIRAEDAAGSAGMVVWLTRAMRRHEGDAPAALSQAAHTILWAALPIWAAAAGGFAAITLLQTGFLVRPESLAPDLGRVSPRRGLKRVMGFETASQAAKALTKLTVLVFGFYIALGQLVPELVGASSWQPGLLLHQLGVQAVRLLVLLLAAQALIAAADVALVRFQHARKMRMSRQELRDEHKESEGNPQVKQRLRQVARLRARRRMMASVPKAAVIITNPTHFAVALAYERGSRGAPRVVARGADEVAARIRDLAREHRVPIVANPPLARALYRVEIDTEIPAEHFKAVAEIIGYLWRMRARVGRQ